MSHLRVGLYLTHPISGLHTSVLLWGLAFVGQALIFSMSVFLFIQCSPTEKNWDKTVDGICLPDGTMIGIEYFVSSYSVFLDLFLAVFPAPFVMRLNMPRKQLPMLPSTRSGLSPEHRFPNVVL